MRTTVRLPDSLLLEAKSFAARHQMTFTAVLEQALREMFTRRGESISKPPIRLPTFRGDAKPGIDLSRSAALLEAMEDDHESL